MANSDKKESFFSKRAYFSLYIFYLCIFLILGCEKFSQDCDAPFQYSLFGKAICFPLSADEAVANYGLFANLHDSLKANKATLSVYFVGVYDYARYAPRTAYATRKYYNKDIYAINVHLRDRALTIDKVIDKLQKDFKGTFTKKRTRMDRVGDFYEMEINDCVIIQVYNTPIFNSVYGLGTINVLFTYKLTSTERMLMLETSGSIRGD